MNQVATLPKRSLVDSMAAKYEMEPAAFIGAIKATVIKGDCSNEQFAAFLMVAKEYDLNPLTKEIYAFPDRGGITPIVSIDGWMNLINSHPQFDGMEFTDVTGDDGKLYSVECRMYRKDRARPVSVIEYMSECFRSTDPWKKWPNRMLRHKAAIQCARYAFGFSGIMEPDEYERMRDVTPAPATSVMDRLKAQNAAQEPQGEREGFSRSFIADQTDERQDALTGEIIDNQNTDERGPANEASSVADEVPSASSQEDGGEVLPPSASSPSSTLSADTRQHLMDFARKGFRTLGEDMDNAGKLSAIDDMIANYRDAIPEADWSKLSTIKISIQAVLAGKRTVDQARSFVATDLLDCSPAEIGGAA